MRQAIKINSPDFEIFDTYVRKLKEARETLGEKAEMFCDLWEKVSEYEDLEDQLESANPKEARKMLKKRRKCAKKILSYSVEFLDWASDKIDVMLLDELVEYFKEARSKFSLW